MLFYLFLGYVVCLGFFKQMRLMYLVFFLPNQKWGSHAAGIRAVSRLYLFSLFPVCVP